MAYTINKYDGSQVTVVADGTIDNTLDIKLIGKNYAGYGQVQNENFVYLLENFASTTQPSKPVRGQVWFDSANRKLKFYDGIKWRTTGGAEIGGSQPTGLTVGDFWYDTANNQLYAWNGSQYILVGPQGVVGSGTTQMISRAVLDNQNPPVAHPIIEAVINDNTQFIISHDAFTLGSSNTITGFTGIKKGVTLAYTNPTTGITSTDDRFWGTASNADKLGGIAASNFVQAGSANFDSEVHFSDLGYFVGNSDVLRVFIQASTRPYIRNQLTDSIDFQTTVSGSLKTPLKLSGLNAIPGEDNISTLGTSSFKWSNVYATTFTGIATQSDTLKVGASYRSADIAQNVNTIAARDGSGNIFANIFQGQATSAQFADLAEKYLADVEYDVGTVVCVGGDAEVTATRYGDRAIGAVSANPAFMMNKDLDGGTYIALKGRVPVKIWGSVKKGDRLIGYKDGTARSISSEVPDEDESFKASNIFAIALSSSDDEGVKLVEALIL
jgi:hypothetical protein